MKKLFVGPLFPPAVDVLVLRLVVGITLFLRHGVEKLAHFSAMSAHFPDPIHICNIAVVWVFVHHFQFFGPKGDHGEIMVNYLGAMAALFLIGGGRYSLDYWLAGGRSIR